MKKMLLIECCGDCPYLRQLISVQDPIGKGRDRDFVSSHQYCCKLLSKNSSISSLAEMIKQYPEFGHDLDIVYLGCPLQSE